MSIPKSALSAPWTQSLVREAIRPVFPRLPAGIRPYLLAGLLFAATSAVMYVGDAALLRYGFSWALVSLLVIVAAANLWGTRPAILVLGLSALYGAVMVPHLQPHPAGLPAPGWQVVLVRTWVFVACGATTIWLTDRARRMQERAETRRGVVTALRSMILPDALAAVPGYDLSDVSHPFHAEEEVGGDFYDFYPLGAGRYGLLIGDVVGKGKEAAASIALLRYSARAFSSSDVSPARILDQLNRMIETQEFPLGTASLFLGVLDTRSGALRYASAGHEPPMLRRTCGEEEILDATGPVLGIGLDIAYGEEEAVLGVEDALLLMTDGVTEARSEQGEFLDSAGTWRLFRAALHAPSSQEALAVLDAALAAHIGGNRSDDIAMLLLRRTSDIAETPPTVSPDGLTSARIVLGRGSLGHAAAVPARDGCAPEKEFPVSKEAWYRRGLTFVPFKDIMSE